jgi:hypothetical protein
MIQDPIINEVRQLRLQTEEACGHDWTRLAEHYRRIKPEGILLVRLEPKRLPIPAVKKS